MLAEVSVHIHHNVDAYQSTQQTAVIPLRSDILLPMQAGTDTHCPVTPGLSTAHQVLFVCLMKREGLVLKKDVYFPRQRKGTSNSASLSKASESPLGNKPPQIKLLSFYQKKE